MASLQTELFGKDLKSPFILTSGPISGGAAGMIRAFRAGAGAVATKTIVRSPSVNPIPHIAADRNTVFNAEGNSDIAARRWIEQEIPTALDAGVVVIASVGVHVDDVVELLPDIVATGVELLELTSYDEEQILPMVRAARKVTDLPLLLKSRFYWKEATYRACFAAGANGVSAIDSVGPVLRVDIRTAKPMLGSAGGRGWMSGASILPISLRVVADVRALNPKATVIGVGGVSNARTAVEMLMAGANAVGLCSLPMLRGVEVFAKLNSELAALLDELGYGSVDQVSSLAQENLITGSELKELSFAYEPGLCNECLKCVVGCPYAARDLQTGSKYMRLERALCRSCGLCLSLCPTGALSGNWLVAEKGE